MLLRAAIAADSAASQALAHFRLRRAVFVHEQGLFAGDDRDTRDEEPETLHAVGLVDCNPCGAVRAAQLRGL